MVFDDDGSNISMIEIAAHAVIRRLLLDTPFELLTLGRGRFLIEVRLSRDKLPAAICAPEMRRITPASREAA